MSLRGWLKTLGSLLPLAQAGVEIPKDPKSKREFMKAMIPNSWFTRRGPGVEFQARKAFRKLDPEDRVYVVEQGWIPREWLKR